jgi:hypothetical protein
MSVQLSYVPVEVSLVEDFVACLTHNLFHIFKVLHSHHLTDCTVQIKKNFYVHELCTGIIFAKLKRFYFVL